MIVEQIRYYVAEDDCEALLVARRAISHAREARGIPSGHIFVADPVPDDGPAVISQCGYDDDTQMGMAESQLLGDPEYEQARVRLGELAVRIEWEIYTGDEE